MAVTEADLENLFTYHSPVGDQPKRYEMIRAASKQLARIILQTTPVGPDQQAAIRKIREGMMTANAAVACASPGDFIVEPTQSGDKTMMPRYQCHKKVWALKIKEIEQAPKDNPCLNAGGDWYLIPERTAIRRSRWGTTPITRSSSRRSAAITSSTRTATNRSRRRRLSKRATRESVKTTSGLLTTLGRLGEARPILHTLTSQWLLQVGRADKKFPLPLTKEKHGT
jgi:hypothetical protein